MTEAASFSGWSADLPLDVTTFVGRRSERSQIRELMSGSRLVTLTGFGGIGKSRLALRMASDLRRVFPDGVYVVALGEVAHADAVPDQIAASLGLHGRSNQASMIAVVEYLRPRTALVVLDNCEHVVEMAALIADTLIRTSPGVKLLATSREPLRVNGEAVHPVKPLSVPGQAYDDSPLQEYEAVQLFLDRARTSAPNFTLSEDNREAVAAITRKLEGIPLAIELAAARLRAFTPAELDGRLTDRWELLSMGSRTAPYRHSTMAACIEWSFDLCTSAEQLLWAEVSMFADGFELDAALSVCSDPEVTEPVEETLASLVEKSIVTPTQHHGINRYRMLPPIRHRGRVELARLGRETDLRERHADFFVGLISRTHDDWFGPRQPGWIDRLRRERANIGKALELCAVEPSRADAGLSAAAGIVQFGLMEGRFKQGQRWFDRIFAAPSENLEVRALALRAPCLWAAMEGDVNSAKRLLEEGRALAAQVGGEAEALLTQAAGFVAIFGGDLTGAEQLLSEARLALAGSENKAEFAFCSALLALDRTLLGNFDGALDANRVCLKMTESAGETWLRSWAIWIAGLALATQGDTKRAGELLAQSLRLKRLISDPVGIAVLLETIAWVTVATDHPERTATLLGAAQKEWDKLDASSQVFPGLHDPHDQSTRAARSLLGDEAFHRAWSAGRALDRSTAIALALEEESPSPGPTKSGNEVQGSPQVLTRREREIAQLVRQGLTNKDIADRLVISRRTAEAHVEHILTKLGFTNRRQIAAWISEQSGPSAH